MTPKRRDARRGPKGAPAPEPDAPAGARDQGPRTPVSARGERATLVLWAALAALAALRAALTFAPGMWLWSLNVQRFLSPAWAWIPWLPAALALLPPLARRLLPALGRAGDAAARRPALATPAWMAGAAVLTWALPDRVRFVGDFLLRQGAIEEDVRPASVFPQALPLDVFLHVRLPVLLMAWLHVDGAHATRLIGALEAALLAAVAVAFARAMSLRGAAAVAVTATVLFGGSLAVYTGYSKSLTELALLTGATGVFALSLVREGRGLVPLGVCVALGLLLHRSALGFLPVAALAVGWTLADPARRRVVLRPAGAFAMALPAVALAAVAPRMLATLTHGDVAVHLASDEVVRGGGLLGTMIAGARGTDLVSLVVLLSPLALGAPVALAALGRPPRGRELVLLLVLAAPFVALLLVIHPAQGMFRDWDDFAETGVALCMVTAWVVGESLRAAPRHAWVAVAVTLGVAAPAVQWMAHQTDTARGMERVRAFLREPPPRSEAERGKTWDYLGIREYRLEHWDMAAQAFGEAARTVPSPRILTQLAQAELQRGNAAGARVAFERVVARDSADVFAWTQLAGVAMQQGDTATMRRAATAILRVRPGDPDGMGILRVLGSGAATRP
jgi:hypothetical protein